MKLEKVSNALWLVCIAVILMFPTFVNPVIATTADDPNNYEVGVEWVEDYTQYSQAHPGDKLNNLIYSQEEAEGFYNTLGSDGWTKKFNWGNALAWESDFEKSAVGGYDYVYIDDVDFAYFSGHGWYDEFYFGTNCDGDGVNYTWRVHCSEVVWGDQDLEWIILSACLVLNWNPEGYDVVYDRWGWPVFHGLHAILGFDTSMKDTNMPWPYSYYTPGELFVLYLIGTITGTPETIHQSWELMTKNWQKYGTIEGDVWGAALGQDKIIRKARETIHIIGYNDHLPGYGYVMADLDPPDWIMYHRWLCTP